LLNFKPQSNIEPADTKDVKSAAQKRRPDPISPLNLARLDNDHLSKPSSG